MTHKEKAEELVKQFRDEIEMESDNGFDIRDEPNLQHLGKKCALICVDKILVCLYDIEFYKQEDAVKTARYWLAVKQEIEKL